MYARHLSFLNSRYAGQTSEQIDEETSDEDKIADNSKHADALSCHSDEESSIINLKRQKTEKTARIEFVDTPNVPCVDFNHTGEDEDRSFFDSLLPAVREFDLDQKLEFRCEVLKLIKYIRSGTTKLKAENTESFHS